MNRKQIEFLIANGFERSNNAYHFFKWVNSVQFVIKPKTYQFYLTNGYLDLEQLEKATRDINDFKKLCIQLETLTDA
ncbi:MAG: hypothetical protein R3Y05_01550 [bacterium]